jgi:oxygen-independent coproporphyrinogen-3 oxidase
MIEEGTPLAALADAGSLEKIDDDQAVAIYEATHTICTAFGYEHYEISNFARSGHHCRHNETYWRNGEYVGLGAGACSYLSGYRLKYEPDPLKWTERVLSGLPAALVEKEALDDEQRAGETLMLALRTAEGLDLGKFCREFNLDPKRFTIRVKALVESGLALSIPGKLALDPLKGFLLQSEVAQMFM